MASFVYLLCRFTARFGAFVVGALAVLSVTSIAGRALSGMGLGPVPGDFELVEAGTALAVFCSLPWCYLVRGHATVDIFWSAFPAPMKRAIQVLTSSLMLLVWAVLTWRMIVATGEYRATGEVSFILQMPVWWGVAACVPPAVIGCLAYAWRLLEELGVAAPPAGAPRAEGGH